MEVNPEDLRKARQLLGEKIKHYREVFAEKTQEELARDAQIDRSWLINIEKGHQNYTIDELVSVVLACGVTFDDFLSGLERTDIKPEHRDYHKNLTIILNAGSREITTGIRVNLRAIAKEAIAFKQAQKKTRRVNARASPSPAAGEAGHDKKNKHAS